MRLTSVLDVPVCLADEPPVDPWQPAVASGAAAPVERQDMLGLLDCLSFGIAWVCPEGGLAAANLAARVHLSEGRALQLSRGLVTPADRHDLPAWARALHAATLGRRGYLTLCRQTAPCAIALLPSAEYGRDRARLVGMVFGAPPGRGTIAVECFGRSHGLTLAEQSVLNILSDGCGASEAAEAIGCSVHTVRTHVRSILAKTAEPNLRRLLCRIGALPPVGVRQGVRAGEGTERAADPRDAAGSGCD